MSLTKDILTELFVYDEHTGILTNKVNRGPRARKDMEVGSVYHHKQTGKSYKRVKLNGKSYRVHRLIWVMLYGEMPDQIDHINGNGLDNSKLNLRNVSAEENSKNKRRRRNNTSGVQGVHLHKPSNKWCARISIDRQETHLGYFDTFEEAVAERKNAEIANGYHTNHGNNRAL